MFVASFTILVALSWVRVPVPRVHDEFSYLLAADTFVNGRLTNPTPKAWRHFETMHVLVAPTYASKYPPGQGLFLALGQWLTGRPIVGVWISTAAAAAACCWMLRQWLPPRWANLGSWLVLLHPTLLFLWSQGFMGGSVATFGAALLLGAYGQARRNELSLGSAICAASGLIVLANSRPFEGLLISAPITFAFLVHSWRTGRWRSPRTLRSAALATLLLIVAASSMLHYNQTITGKSTRLPYIEHAQRYLAAPMFLWQELPANREYRNPQLDRFHNEWEKGHFDLQRSWSGYVELKSGMLQLALHFMTRPILLVFVLVAMGAAYRSFDHAAVAAAVLLMLAGLCTSVWLYPQYLAPGLPAMLLLALQGMRRVSLWRGPRGGFGSAAVRRLATAYFVLLLLPLASFLLFRDAGWHRERERLIVELNSIPGDDLVIVRYHPDHPPTDEWVYNGAELNAEPILWARDLGADANQQLLEAYPGRRVWLLQADAKPPQLTEYHIRLAEGAGS